MEEKINEFRLNLAMFIEAVNAWAEQLDTELQVITSKAPKEFPANVRPFPVNGSRPKPTLPAA